MSDHGWIVIPNWDGPTGFQHYKDRTPKWIKTYVELMSDEAYLGLSGHRRAILHGIWLEYATSRRRLPDDTATLSRRLALRVLSVDLEALNHAGFITFSASAPLAKPEQNRSLEESREDPPHPHKASRKNNTSPRQRGTNPRAEPPATFTCGIGTCPGVYTTQTKLDQHRELAHITAAAQPADNRPDWAYPPATEETP